MQKAINSGSVAIAMVFILDRVLKWYVQKMPATYDAGVFSFGHFLNPALFFLPAWPWIPWLALAVLFTIFGFWILNLFRISDFGFWISHHQALFPIILGGVSNVFDRFSFGGVVDYVEILGLASFNLADILVLMGMILLLARRTSPTHTLTNQQESGIRN